MIYDKKLFFAGVCFFLFFLFYFTSSYKFYPGMQVRLIGQVEKNTPGKIYWDYGYGFNESDSIELTLSPEISNEITPPLGNITIEPAGFKSEKSRGYLFWLVIPQNIYEENKFVIQGKVHWGHWLNVGADTKGRQVALFPGSKIKFFNDLSAYNLNFFKAPQAGYAKVYSDNGLLRFIDGYGKNQKQIVTPFVFEKESIGPIKYISDPFRNKLEQHTYLPRQRIAGVKIETPATQVRDISPWRKIKIIPSSQLESTDLAKSIEKIIINGSLIDLKTNKQKTPSKTYNSTHHLKIFNDYIEISDWIYSYEVHLVSSLKSNSVDIEINDQKAHFNISENKNGQIVYSDRAPILNYPSSVEKVVVVDWNGRSVSIDNTGKNEITVTEDLKYLDQDQFRIILLTIQIFAALICSLLIMNLYYYFIKEKLDNTSANTFSIIFLLKKRWFFAILFTCGISINILFLVAEWPGSLTPDSVTVLKEVRLLQFTNHHPYIYSLLLLAALNIFDNPLTPIIFQIFLYHFLASWFFYFLYRNRVKLYIIIPCFFLSLTSLPINFFNITLWKDIPFSILVLFWALLLTYMLHLRLYEKRQIDLSGSKIISLAIFYFLLCSLRHNGLVYLPIIPIILWFFLSESKRRYFQFLAVSLLLFGGYFLVLPQYVLKIDKEENEFAKEVTAKKMSGLNAVIHNNLEDYYLEDYLAERVKIFVKTLGTSPYVWLWNNDMHEPPQRWFSVDEVRAEMKVNPPSNRLVSIEKRLLGTLDFKGVFAGRFLYWNCLFALCGMIVIFLLSRWFPVSAFYSGFFLYQTAFMFIVVWPRWRYLYYLYLGGIFLLPVFLFELKNMRLMRKNNAHCFL